MVRETRFLEEAWFVRFDIFGTLQRQPMRRFRRSTVLGIEILEHAVAIAQVRRNGQQPSVRQLLSAPIPTEVDRQSAAQMGAFVGELLRGRGIATHVCQVAVPRKEAIVKALELPAGHEGELPDMVNYQAQRVLPLPPSAVLMDYAAHAPDPAKGWQVTLAAARKELAQWYTEFARAAGLRIAALDVGPWPLFRALERYARSRADEPYAFLEVGAESALMGVASQGRLQASRGVSAGSSAPEQLVLEVRRSLAAFNAAGHKPQRLVLAGPHASPELAARLREELDLDAAVAAHPDIAQAVPADESALRPEAFLGAVGLAIRDFSPLAGRFNLFHSTFERQRHIVRRRRLKRLTLAAACVVGVLAGPWVAIEVKKYQIGKVRSQLDAIRPQSERLGQFRESLRRFAPWFQERPRWIEALNMLSSEKVMPYGVYLSLLSFAPVAVERAAVQLPAGGFECKIMGRARADKYVYDLVDALNASGRFQKTKADYVREAKSKETGEGVDFSLTAVYVPSATSPVHNTPTQRAGPNDQ